MTKIFVDTAFVLAIVNKRDGLHQKANGLAEKFGPRPWLTTDLVLYEVGNALARNSKPQAERIINDFLQSDGVEIVSASPDLFRQGFALYCDFADKTWGLIDCVSFVVMKEHNIVEALTNDRHFQQAGFKALMRDT